MTEHQRHWNERYLRQDTPWETGQPNQEMQRLFKSYAATGASVIDTGCGLGTNALWLAQQGYKVTGVDISAAALEQANQQAQAKELHIDYLTLDFLHEWDKLGKYDLVFDCAVFHLFKEIKVREKFVHAAASICTDDGYWISICCSADSADKISKRTGVDAPPYVSAQDIMTVVEPRFEIIEMKRCEFTIQRNNQGTAAFNAWGCVFKKRG